MKKFTVIVITIFILSACGQSEFDKYFDEGKDAFESDDYIAAKSSLESALEIEPGDKDAISLLNRVNYALDKKEKEKKRQEEKEKHEIEEKRKQKAEDNYLKSIDTSTIEGKAELKLYKILSDYNTPPEKTITEISYKDDNNTLEITIPGKENLTKNMTVEGFHETTYSIWRNLYRDKNFDEIETFIITIELPGQDNEGRNTEITAMRTLADRTDLDEVNWKAFNYNNVPLIATGYQLHPELQ